MLIYLMAAAFLTDFPANTNQRRFINLVFGRTRINGSLQPERHFCSHNK
jgi:hypothetical protein